MPAPSDERTPRCWTVSSYTAPFPIWRHLNLGLHCDFRHPMLHIYVGIWQLRIGRHYFEDGVLCANDPHEWKLTEDADAR